MKYTTTFAVLAAALLALFAEYGPAFLPSTGLVHVLQFMAVGVGTLLVYDIAERYW